MELLQALILGIIQGITEYLPVSSSGHLEIAEYLYGFEERKDLVFPILVHAATCLSSIIIFWKDIRVILGDLLLFKWNESYEYASKIILSSVPVVILGLLFEKEIEAFFNQNMLLVGGALIFTGILLLITYWAPDGDKKVGWWQAVIIGISQAIAVTPGISRSGATISTALMMGIDRNKAAKFSFLMVIIPIMGKATLDTKDWLMADAALETGFSTPALLVGFIAAFVTGLLACNAMLKIVRTGKLYWFSIYCFVIGTVAIISTYL